MWKLQCIFSSINYVHNIQFQQNIMTWNKEGDEIYWLVHQWESSDMVQCHLQDWMKMQTLIESGHN